MVVQSSPILHTFTYAFQHVLYTFHPALHTLHSGRPHLTLLLAKPIRCIHHPRPGAPQPLITYIGHDIIHLHQRTAERWTGQEQRRGQPPPLLAVDGIADVARPQPKQLSQQEMLEKSNRSQQRKHGRLVHPIAQAGTLGLLATRPDRRQLHYSMRRYSEILGHIHILPIHHHQVIRPIRRRIRRSSRRRKRSIRV